MRDFMIVSVISLWSSNDVADDVEEFSSDEMEHLLPLVAFIIAELQIDCTSAAIGRQSGRVALHPIEVGRDPMLLSLFLSSFSLPFSFSSLISQIVLFPI